MKASKQKNPPRKAAAPAPAPSRVSTRTLVVAAAAAVALAVALFGFQAGWFASSEDDASEFNRAAAPRDTTPQKIASAAGGVVRASWEPLPAGAPVAGVGPGVGDGAPSQVAVPVEDGRAAAGVRLPRKRPAGAPYTAYTVELRSGTNRVWSTYLPIVGIHDDFPVMSLAFDAGTIRAGGVDTSAMTLVVTGVAVDDHRREKRDTIGEARLSLN